MKMFSPGERVRLHSGRDYGTIVEQTSTFRALVRWDSGSHGSWHTNELMLVPEAPASAATSGMIEDTPMALDAEAWEDE